MSHSPFRGVIPDGLLWSATPERPQRPATPFVHAAAAAGASAFVPRALDPEWATLVF